MVKKHNRFTTWLIAAVWERHTKLHDGDYEVCTNLLCRFVYWLELKLRPEWYSEYLD